jgi:hypothetical protein
MPGTCVDRCGYSAAASGQQIRGYEQDWVFEGVKSMDFSVFGRFLDLDGCLDGC